MALGKIKAGMKLADVIAQATGRQLNKIGSKLGMDKDILDGLDKNKIKGAMLDEAQLYMRNKRKNTNRRVGAAAAAGAAATTVAYSVSDFVRDMLGIKSAGDGELSASERPKPSDKKSKKSSEPTPTSRPTQRRKQDSEEPTPKPRPKPKAKESTSGVKFIDLTGTPTKRNTGATDFRKGGMVLSTVDRRKK
jgi:hypothetical protein